MNKAVKKFSSKRFITISAILVSIYLAMLITVTSVGQNKLKESQYRELDLKVKSYASTLDNLFTIASEDVDNLATDKTIQTFFGNLASGMSMEYGLGASLINLKRRFDEKIDSKLINSSQIYKKLTLVGSDGVTIVTTGSENIAEHKMDIQTLMTPHGHPEEVCATRYNDDVR
ncbi:GGDEF-domain containing protein, partial [Vibrio parahaemolyticus]|nr:GGDEF-domain containing protein [Vibrio parahaemolyticus]